MKVIHEPDEHREKYGVIFQSVENDRAETYSIPNHYAMTVLEKEIKKQKRVIDKSHEEIERIWKSGTIGKNVKDLGEDVIIAQYRIRDCEQGIKWIISNL